MGSGATLAGATAQVFGGVQLQRLLWSNMLCLVPQLCVDLGVGLTRILDQEGLLNTQEQALRCHPFRMDGCILPCIKKAAAVSGYPVVYVYEKGQPGGCCRVQVPVQGAC
jgi:hypothetical protein